MPRYIFRVYTFPPFNLAEPPRTDHIWTSIEVEAPEGFEAKNWQVDRGDIIVCFAEQREES